MKPYLYAAAALAALIALSTATSMIYSAGQRSITEKLKDKRITVLKDGQRIDENVFSADDDALYCMLTDCKPD